MHITWVLHVYLMGIICILYWYHMYTTWVSYVYHMDITCTPHGYHMYTTWISLYTTWVSYVYHMDITVHHMDIICIPHGYHCIPHGYHCIPHGYHIYTTMQWCNHYCQIWKKNMECKVRIECQVFRFLKRSNSAIFCNSNFKCFLGFYQTSFEECHVWKCRHQQGRPTYTTSLTHSLCWLI